MANEIKNVQLKNKNNDENIYPVINMDSTVVDGSETKTLRNVIDSSNSYDNISASVKVPIVIDGSIQTIDVSKHPIFRTYKITDTFPEISGEAYYYDDGKFVNPCIQNRGVYVQFSKNALMELGYASSGPITIEEMLDAVIRYIKKVTAS